MINIYSEKEILVMREGGKILSKIFKNLRKKIKIGVSLRELDNFAHQEAKRLGAKPAFFGYRPEGARYPYPFAICASVNNVIVHGQPNNYKLRDGDVLKIDFGIKFHGYYTDSAFTIIVGKSNPLQSNLLKATQKALDEAIKIAKPEKTLGDIGYAIEKTAKKYGVNVIRGLTGHGVGRQLHEEPTVYNYGEKGKGIILKPGMVIAIEPMLSMGSPDIKQLSDESWATIDNSLSAQFEHTIAITGKGNEILTK